MPADFDLGFVEAGITETPFAGRVRHFPSVSSTNVLALDAAQAGTRCGAWIADEQTAGRGRGGHSWHSAAGEGLYVSALMAPTMPIGTALKISLAAGLAARKAIAEVTRLTIDIRWPNDLMAGERKCGGILVETAVDAAGMLRYAVVGIGINLNHEAFPAELAEVATSLRLECGTPVPREAMLAALLRELEREVTLLTQDGGHELLRRFAEASTWARGKRVQVAEGAGYTGVTRGLDADGFLLVDGEDGVRHTVLSGGVRGV